MASRFGFSDDEMKVDDGLGYPRAYPKLCRDRNLSPYSHGPPFTFTPYPWHPQMAMREKELDELFPIIDLNAKPTTKPKIFLGLLWKQLNHIGNAGFDPAMYRVDPYGNVLYYYADSASPLAWEIDHWFPCSRGGLTVPSNLRIIQWQVCKRKQNKLENLIPWWDLQLGISVNQFLSIFAAYNSDFRDRAFSLLFLDGASEELDESQSVDSHNFPQPFLESKERVGLAAAAVVFTQKDPYDTTKITDTTKRPRPSAVPIIPATKSKHGMVLKENEKTDMITNPYQAIVMARDSLKQRDCKMKTEIERTDDQVDELKERNEEEKATIQDLEMALIERRRRVEKCRRLSEAQSSYRTMLEKMIRDAMHQSVVYKEQVRLNQAASNALMARLEAQKGICDSAEKELHKKLKRKEELEKQIRPEVRKRLRMDDTLQEDQAPTELVGMAFANSHKAKPNYCSTSQLEGNNADRIDEVRKFSARLPIGREMEMEDDEEETKKERGKGNVEKWLEKLLGNTEEGWDQLNGDSDEEPEIIGTSMSKLNERHPQKEMRTIQFPEHIKSYEQKKEETAEIDGWPRSSTPMRSVSGNVKEASEFRERCDKRKSFGGVKERSESSRSFRPILSSQSMMLGISKGVSSKRKNPLVIDGEDSDQENIPTNIFLKSSTNSTKKATDI